MKSSEVMAGLFCFAVFVAIFAGILYVWVC